MVTSKDTRKPVAARKPRLKPTRRPPTPTPLLSTLRADLGTMLRELELVRATTVVAAATLDAQAADLDTDVAHILRRYASDRLHVMVEKVAAALAALEAAEPRRLVH